MKDSLSLRLLLVREHVKANLKGEEMRCKKKESTSDQHYKKFQRLGGK